MTDLPITLACWNYDRTRALMDGSVKPDGINLRYENLFPADNFPRMMRDREFEAAELGLTFYLATLHLDDPPFVAIPVYPIRLFCHAQIYINTHAGIERPQDLLGKRVGEFFLYGHDAGIWSKGILSDHYGVPADSYRATLIGGVEHPTPPLPWYPLKPPAHLPVQHVGTGTTLDAMLDAGEIDALFSALVPASLRRNSPNVARLFPNFETVERDYFRQTGIFPIQHIVAIRKDVYRQNPWVAGSLYKAFAAARDQAYATYRHQAANMHRAFMIPWITQHCLDMQDLLGDDWFPYGVQRNWKALDTFCRYFQEQGLTTRRFRPEELFVPEVLAD
jgi:4,5-dihydroxyphthalate decarboxylase